MSSGKIAVQLHGRDVGVAEFDALWDSRHVYKHVLNPAEGWQEFYGGAFRLTAIKQQVDSLGCKGYDENKDEKEIHGPPCPNFGQCEAHLRSLYPIYRDLIIQSISMGATLPRHTHNRRPIPCADGRVRIFDTNFFLASNGILAETTEKAAHQIVVRTAYRVAPKHNSPTTRDFFRTAQQKVINGRIGQVKTYCTDKTWDLARLVATTRAPWLSQPSASRKTEFKEQSTKSRDAQPGQSKTKTTRSEGRFTLADQLSPEQREQLRMFGNRSRKNRKNS